MMTRALGSIHAAVPTPITRDGKLDAEGASRLFERLVGLGLDGALLLGSMGEGPWLTEATREAMIESAVQRLRGRMTLFASVADSSRARMIDRVRRYARLGVDLNVLCLPPGVPQPEAIADVLAVAEASPVPCLFYHIPAVTGHTLNLEALLSVLRHDNVVALKESSGNSLLAQGLTADEYRAAGVQLFDGDEYRTTYSALLGFNGVMHGGGALTGRWIREVWDAAKSGQHARALELDRDKALCLAQIYNRFSSPLQNVLGQKYALNRLGGFGDAITVRADQTLNDEDRQRIESAVERYQGWLETAAVASEGGLV